MKKKSHISYQARVESFFNTPEIQQLMMWHTVFLGGTPKSIPSLYTMMAHVDFNLGTYYPEKGIRSVADAFYQLAMELGIRFYFNEEVTNLSSSHGRVSKLQTKNGSYTCDYLIGSADMAHIETSLLKEQDRTHDTAYWQKQDIAPSVFLLYLGIKKKLPMLRHHNYFFTGDWRKHFEELKGTCFPSDPLYYVSATSVTDQSSAPDGCENIFLLVPIPAGMEETIEDRNNHTKCMIARFERDIATPIQREIEVLRVLSVRDQEQIYRAYQGTAFGLSQTAGQSALLRPKHKSSKLRNLYYTGQYAHPGIGMPSVVAGSIGLYESLKKKMR